MKIFYNILETKCIHYQGKPIEFNLLWSDNNTMLSGCNVSVGCNLPKCLGLTDLDTRRDFVFRTANIHILNGLLMFDTALGDTFNHVNSNFPLLCLQSQAKLALYQI